MAGSTWKRFSHKAGTSGVIDKELIFNVQRPQQWIVGAGFFVPHTSGSLRLPTTCHCRPCSVCWPCMATTEHGALTGSSSTQLICLQYTSVLHGDAAL